MQEIHFGCTAHSHSAPRFGNSGGRKEIRPSGERPALDAFLTRLGEELGDKERAGDRSDSIELEKKNPTNPVGALLEERLAEVQEEIDNLTRIQELDPDKFTSSYRANNARLSALKLERATLEKAGRVFADKPHKLTDAIIAAQKRTNGTLDTMLYKQRKHFQGVLRELEEAEVSS